MAPKRASADEIMDKWLAEDQMPATKQKKGAKNKSSAAESSGAGNIIIIDAGPAPEMSAAVAPAASPRSQFMGELDLEMQTDGASAAARGAAADETGVTKGDTAPGQMPEAPGAAAADAADETGDTKGDAPPGQVPVAPRAAAVAADETGDTKGDTPPGQMPEAPGAAAAAAAADGTGDAKGDTPPGQMPEAPGAAAAAAADEAGDTKGDTPPGQMPVRGTKRKAASDDKAPNRSTRHRSLSTETLRFGDSPAKEGEATGVCGLCKDQPTEGEATGVAADVGLAAAKDQPTEGEATGVAASPTDAQAEDAQSPSLHELSRMASFLAANPHLRKEILASYPQLQGGSSSSSSPTATEAETVRSELEWEGLASLTAAIRDPQAEKELASWRSSCGSEAEEMCRSSQVSLESITSLANIAAEPCSPHCQKCGKSVDAFRAQIKSKMSDVDAVRWVCRECNCIVTNFSKHMQWPPTDFAGMSKMEQQEFFRDCHLTRQGDSRFTYGQLRACLTTSLAKRLLKTRTAEVTGKFLPLTWYKYKGCTQEQLDNIEQIGECEMHPILGPTYRVPIKSISVSVATQQIEEVILKAETALKAKSQKQLQDEGSKLTSLEDHVAGEEVPVVVVPPAAEEVHERSPEEIKAAEEKAKKEADRLAKEADKAKKEADRKEKSAIAKHNSSQANLATKVVTTMTATLARLQACKKHACFPQIPDMITSQFDTFMADMKDKQTKSKDLLAKQASAAAKGTKLPELDFKITDVQKLAKDSLAEVAKAEAILKVLKK